MFHFHGNKYKRDILYKQEGMQEKSQIKRNILQYIKYKGITKYDFYKKTGITRGVLDQPTGISEDNIARFIAYFSDVNIEWLITNKGSMLKENILSPTTKPNIQAQQNNNLSPSLSPKGNNAFNPSDPKFNTDFSDDEENQQKIIPLVGEQAVAGFGNAAFALEANDVKDYYVVPKFKDRRIDFMIEIHGMSMVPTFYPGDVVACTIIRESCFIQWNRVYLIATEEQGILIKRLKKSTNETAIKLVSDNPDYDPFDVELTDIKGLALVQGIIRLE